MKKHVFARGLSVIVVCGFILMLLGAATLFPDLVHQSFLSNPQYAQNETGVFIFLYLTSIPLFLALLALHRVCRFVIADKPFSPGCVQSVRLIGICALVDAVLYLFGVVTLLCIGMMHYGMLVVGGVVALSAFTISLICAVITQLLKTAIRLQEENELTI